MRILFLLLMMLITSSIMVDQTLSKPVRIERGNIVTEDIPLVPERITQKLSQYQNTRSAAIKGWLPAGNGLIISTRFGETSQLHWVQHPGGARQQITFFSEPVIGRVDVNPAAERNGFLFTKDVGGSEAYQIFFFDMQTATAQLLTDGTSRNGGPLWSNKGDRFAYYSTERNGRDIDLYVAPLDNPDAAEAVLAEDGSGSWWIAQDWSPDDSRLLVEQYISAVESNLYILDLNAKRRFLLFPARTQVRYGQMRFSKDGKGVYYTSDLQGDFMQLQYYDFATGQTSNLTQDLAWDIENFTLSHDGHLLAYTINQDGISQLHVIETKTQNPVELPPLPQGIVHGLRYSPDSQQLGFVLNSPNTPGDVFSIDLSTQELVRWTHSETGGLNSETFIAPTLIRYPTFDQVNGKPRMIPAFYYQPRGKGPFPVLIDIHGGPESQARPYFHPIRQYILSELGVAVLVPNVRGSDGYGNRYLQLDNGYQREDAVQDIGKLLDWIETQPELDHNRIAVSGGSYGGYMALAAMTHFNDRLRGAIDVVGISNFVTFLQNTKDYRRDLRRQEYGDERDPEMRAFLEQISPTTNAHNITKPILIVQGLNDPRVPVTESEQMVKVIRNNGNNVWYLLAKDEGHGFRKKTNRDYFSNVFMLFLENVLLNDLEPQ